jgi:hypothetical protein
MKLPKASGAASHMDLDKAFNNRLQVTEEQKAKTVQQYLKTPSMSYSDLGEWCKEEFNLDKTPSNAAICQWLKPDKRIELLQLLKTETALAQLAMKCLSHYKPENPELEDGLYAWYRKHEQRQSVITDDLTLQLGTKRALVDFNFQSQSLLG